VEKILKGHQQMHLVKAYQNTLKLQLKNREYHTSENSTITNSRSIYGRNLCSQFTEITIWTTNFRPAQFSFIPQPDYRTAREPSEEGEIADEGAIAGKQPTANEQVWNRANRKTLNFEAPMRPLDVARDMYLDYTSPQSIKFYNKGCERLPGEPFNGKMLLTWLVHTR
jgi:hypothetical protein